MLLFVPYLLQGAMKAFKAIFAAVRALISYTMPQIISRRIPKITVSGLFEFPQMLYAPYLLVYTARREIPNFWTGNIFCCTSRNFFSFNRQAPLITPELCTRMPHALWYRKEPRRRCQETRYRQVRNPFRGRIQSGFRLSCCGKSSRISASV